MKNHKEKRTSDRFSHNAPLICSRFHRHDYFCARKINHGGRGLCFECQSAIKKGTVLYIRLDECNTNGLKKDAWEGFCSISVAEVKWCKEISDDAGNHYRVGVRYYDPAC
jgi:hypothetical protein